MNNKLEVIGIDHGWSMMKTISQVFVTGVKEITTTPALFGDVLEYEGKFYKVGTVRQEVKDTKVEDDSFYLLTLAAVAKELKRRGLAEAKVFLAVGLPLTRFGAEKNDFIKYLTKNKRVSFKYENEPYYIEIDDVRNQARQQPREMQALKVQFMVFMRETISCIRTEQQESYSKQETL